MSCPMREYVVKPTWVWWLLTPGVTPHFVPEEVWRNVTRGWSSCETCQLSSAAATALHITNMLDMRMTCCLKVASVSFTKHVFWNSNYFLTAINEWNALENKWNSMCLWRWADCKILVQSFHSAWTWWTWWWWPACSQAASCVISGSSHAFCLRLKCYSDHFGEWLLSGGLKGCQCWHHGDFKMSNPFGASATFIGNKLTTVSRVIVYSRYSLKMNNLSFNTGANVEHEVPNFWIS